MRVLALCYDECCCCAGAAPHQVAGTLLTAELALEHGLAANTAGGTHHAHYDFGSGFCILNDLAFTAATLIKQRRVDRVLILDLDVHQVRRERAPSCRQLVTPCTL